MIYKVVLHRSNEGYSVNCPGLTGCWSEDDARDEALDNIRDAIREYLAVAESRQSGTSQHVAHQHER